MKRTVLLLLCALGCGSPGGPAAAPLKAGVARVDITPPGPIRLSGYASRNAPSAGVEHPIHARAFAFEDAQGGRAVVVSADAIAVSAAITDEAARRLGLPRERFMLATTHSHTAPALAGVIPNILDLSARDREVIDRYTEQFTAGIVEAARAALRDLAPAALALGHGSAGVAGNRRTPGGPVDQDVPVLRIAAPDGRLRGLLYGYACHCTTLDTNQVGGDWAGYASAELEKDGVVAGCLIGCGADQNPMPRRTQELARRHGRAVAQAVTATGGRPIGGAVDARFANVDLPWDKLPSKEELEKMLETGAPQNKRLARMLLDRLARGALAPSIPYPIQALSLGTDLTFVFLGGEVVVDYALRMKREYDPERIWPVGYANDVPGYIPSLRIHNEGGYEGGGAMVWYGQPSRFAPQVEEIIQNKIRELVPAALRRPAPPPVHSPTTPKDSLRHFEIEPGFEIDLVACEPLVRDPIHVSWDAKGRMYVTEMIDYPEGPPAGRIMRLEDPDGDGFYDAGSVFAPKLPYPTSCMPWKTGVLVTSDPDLFFLEDTDGDGVADLRKVLFTGFAGGNTQHRVNSLQWGLDNWVYGGNGDSAATIRGGAGAPVTMTFADFRFRPATGEFETLVEHSGYASAFDDAGNRFVSGSGGNMRHVVLDRALRVRNPFPPGIQNAVSIEGRTKLHPRRAEAERFNDPLDVGFFTAASGLAVYRGGAFPEHYRGNLFIGDSAGNLVHRDVPVRQGAAIKAAPHSQPAEFLASRDPWFRPVYLTTGPDGALYVCDMYRAVIEHPEWIPNDIEKTLDLRAGDDRGRIYRIRHRAFPPNRERLDGDLVAKLESPNGWVRDTVHRLSVEGTAKVSAADLERVAAGSTQPLARLHALWILEGLSALPDSLATKMLGDPDARIREAMLRIQAIRLQGPRSAGTPLPFPADALPLIRDPDLRVRLRAAALLGHFQQPEAVWALGDLIFEPTNDDWIRFAAILSRPDVAYRVLARVAERIGASASESARMIPFVWRLSQVVGARDDAAEVKECLDLLLPKPDGRMTDWQMVGLGGGIVMGLARKHRVPGSRLTRDERLERAIDEAARMAEDPKISDGTRYDALRVLGIDAEGRHRAVLTKYLSPKFSPELQDGAIAGLSDLDLAADAATALLEHWAAYAPAQRQGVLDAIFRRPDRLAGLVLALEKRKVSLAELGDNRKEQMRRVTDEPLKARISALLAGDTRADRKKVLEDRQGALRLAGRRAEGVKLFAKHCANCHPVQGVGPAVGPDLVRIRKRDAAGLLMDILDPNASVAPNFVAYNVETKDEVIHSGLVVSQTPAAVTLRLAGGLERTIPRDEIEELRSTGQSLMPPMFETAMTDQDLADLIEYLRQIQ